MHRSWQRFFLATALFIITCGGFIYKQPAWQFGCDDFGAFYSGKNAKFQDLLNYFGHQTNDLTVMPTNMRDRPMSFFAVTYRPLTLVLYAVECALLGAQQSTDAWPYFVVSIVLHALATTVFLLLLSSFVSNLFACCGALAFAFYPFMGRCVGPFSFQPFSLSLILAILSLVAFLRYLKTHNSSWLVLSTLLFTIPLLLHEILIILPLWLFLLALYFYDQQGDNCWAAVRRAGLTTLPFFCVILGYCVARTIIFPPSVVHTQIFNPLEIFTRLKIRFYDLVTLLVDLFGLSFIKTGHRLVKTGSLLLVASWLGLIFLFANDRKRSLLLLFGVGLLCWASVLITHQARYLYYGLPLLLAYFLIAATSIVASSLPRFFCKYSVPGIFLALAAAGFMHNQAMMQAFVARQTPIVEALCSLVNTPAVQNKALFFVGLPHELIMSSGTAQAVWMFGPPDQDGKAVIFDELLSTRCLEVNTPLSSIVCQNFLKIKNIGNKLIIASRNPKEIWMFAANAFGKKTECTVGKVLQLQTDASGARASKVVVALDEQWTGSGVRFVTWDYAQQKFLLLAQE